MQFQQTMCVACTNTLLSVSHVGQTQLYIRFTYMTPIPYVCKLNPHSLYAPKGFVQLHHFACSYCTLSPLVLKTKQTLETTLKTSWENKLPLKVIFPLTLDTTLCFTSKNSCTATVIRIGSCWMYYSFTELSLYVCLFLHISWAYRGDFVWLTHGQWRREVESELLCHIQ